MRLPEGSEKDFEENSPSMLLKPPGRGFFNFGHSRGSLIRERAYQRGRAYSQNQMTRVYVIAFQIFTLYFADSTYIHFNEANT